MALQALAIDSAIEKAAFRFATARLNSGRSEDLLSSPESSFLENIRENQREKILDKISKVKEESNGLYHYQSICKEAYVNGYVDTWHSDFFSSSIEVFETETMGRGVRAKVDLPEGTLLMASKAFTSDISHRYDTFELLKEKTVAKVQSLPDDSDLKTEFFKLHSGRSLDQNATPSSSNYLIPLILKLNAFSMFIDSNKHGCALWLKPSLVNHSCLPNSCQRTIGDFMFIFTTTSVKAGDQFYISYVDLFLPHDERRPQLQRVFGFDCQCPRCTLFMNDEKLLETELLCIQAERTYSKTGNIKSLNKIISKDSRKKLIDNALSSPIELKYSLMQLVGVHLSSTQEEPRALVSLLETHCALSHQIGKSNVLSVSHPFSTHEIALLNLYVLGVVSNRDSRVINLATNLKKSSLD
ncbi:hypothetical protein GEMRC1_002900 [Eukaryota sp. GEM-RC1]